MKKLIFALFAVLFASTSLFAQTTEEILTRMDQETDRFEKEGVSMVMEMKIPLLGTSSSTMYVLGDKYKAVLNVKGNLIISWSDGITVWDYDSSKNELTIDHAKPSEDSQAESNMKMLDGVTDGYDVKLKKETDDAWFFICKKSKNNPRKDDPKKMDLVISKSTFLPISTSVSEKGVKVTMRDFSIGVTEEEVAFDPEKYKNAKIVDKR